MSERTKHDFYETPTWQIAALRRRVQISGAVLECCVGDVSLAKMLSDCEVATNDIDPQRAADFHLDAAKTDSWKEFPEVDWVVTNPPFNLAMPILKAAHAHAKFGVVFLLRLSFMEPTKEREQFLSETPPPTPDNSSALELQAKWLHRLRNNCVVCLDENAPRNRYSSIT